jgi:hypothetical protein
MRLPTEAPCLLEASAVDEGNSAEGPTEAAASPWASISGLAPLE